MKYLFLVAFTLFTVQIKAQEFWEEVNTPDIDRMSLNSCLVVNSDSIFLGTSSYSTNGGLYSTNNGGEDWHFHDLTDYNIGGYSLINYKGVVYAYVDQSLFIKESYEGDWINLGNDQRAGVMVFINDSVIFKGHGEGINKSADGGHTWERVYSTHPNESVETLVQHPNGDLFFGTYTFDQNAIPGVYRSSDMGQSWERVGLEYNNIMTVAVNSKGVLYAGTYGQVDGVFGGIFKSDNQGETWEQILEGVFVKSIVITPGDTIYAGCDMEQVLYGGVFRSTDNGATWSLVNNGIDFPNVYNLTLGGDGHLYAIVDSNQDVLYRSTTAVTGVGISASATNKAIALYPNPAGDCLNIASEGPSHSASVEIVDMQGQVISQQLLVLPGKLNVAGLHTGIYLLQIHEGTSVRIQKFIKQ